MSEPVCLPAEARIPRKKEHDVPKPKNPIILQASILTRKVEEKFSKKFGFCNLQKSGFFCEPQSEPQANLRVQKIPRKVRKTPDFLSKSGVFMVAEAGLELIICSFWLYSSSIKAYTVPFSSMSVCCLLLPRHAQRENKRENSKAFLPYNRNNVPSFSRASHPAEPGLPVSEKGHPEFPTGFGKTSIELLPAYAIIICVSTRHTNVKGGYNHALSR